MTLLTIVSPDAFADKAIEWIFAVGIVIVIAVGVIRWIGDLLD
jgi:hypothetical protein